MSRQNKVNPGLYKTAGRLSTDDLGRELRRQRKPVVEAPTAKRPVWETTPPAPKVAGTRATARKPAGRAKVAAARAAIGVTRVTARGVKAVTGAARRAIGAPAKAAPASKRR